MSKPTYQHYYHAIVDLGIEAGQIIYTGEDQYRLSGDAIVTSLAEL